MSRFSEIKALVDQLDGDLDKFYNKDNKTRINLKYITENESNKLNLYKKEISHQWGKFTNYLSLINNKSIINK